MFLLKTGLTILLTLFLSVDGHHGIIIKKYVRDPTTKNVCIVAQFSATILIEYTDINGREVTSTLEVGPTSQVDDDGESNCQDAFLSLEFEERKHFGIKFKKFDNEICVTNLTFLAFMDKETFPGHRNNDQFMERYIDGKRFCFPLGMSYSCNPPVGLQFVHCNFKLKLSHLRLEAFRNSTNELFNYPEAICPEDKRSLSLWKDKYVIAGIIVGAITISVVIGYFVSKTTAISAFCRNNRNAILNEGS